MKLAAFDFDLPDEAIALRPAVPRDQARLLHVTPDKDFSDHHVFELPSLLRRGDLLVVNDTQVFPAALNGLRKARPVGGGGDVSIRVNLHQSIDETSWRAFVKPAKRLKEGDVIHFPNRLTAVVEDKQDGGDIKLVFSQSGPALMNVIQAIGEVPLPPYIGRQRAVDARDLEDYQTVYARKNGSVAAPTAGLHFTPSLFSALSENGIETVSLTLHVGAGTFLPVKTENVHDHHMHKEWYTIDDKTCASIQAAKKRGGRIIAVGTTSLRALESAARNGAISPKTEETDIFITPGYRFNIVDGLMTNFHLPRSSLFMLVCALAGTETMQKAYGHALKSGYRFYSYGDSSLIWMKR